MLGRFIRNWNTHTSMKNIAMNLSSSYSPRQTTRSRNSNSQPPSGRMKRFWQNTPGTKSSPARGQPQYTFLSYNILAQDLLVEHNQLYYNTDVKWLRWEHRLRKLCQEIAYIRPDILCLQEMQYSHLKVLVSRIKGNRQLEYVFKKKTGHRTDGCVIIYDSQKFRLLEDYGLEYYTQNANALDRENIAVMAKFNLRHEPSKNFVVATTHLLYNPKRHDVRSAQVDKLLAQLDNFAAVDTGTDNTTLPVIVSGDFNCIPYSEPYCKLITPPLARGQTETEQSGQQEARVALVPIQFGDESNTASTCQDEWIIVDYVLHTPGTVQVRRLYKLPTIEECMQMGCIPNQYLGSDHYSLAFSFSVS